MGFATAFIARKTHERVICVTASAISCGTASLV